MAKGTKELPKRSELPKELTWDLEDIFATDEEWEKELNSLKQDIPKIEEYAGKLADSAQTLYDVLKLQDDLSERLGKLFTYSHMRNDEDTTNSFYQELNAKAENVLTLASSSMSYIVPEILTIDEAKLKEFQAEKEELALYKQTLDEIARQRAHVLSQKEEALLAEASEPMENASQTFGLLNNADLTFPAITNEDGEEVDLTHGRYIGFLESKDRSVREAAFKAMYDTYGSFKNTFSSTLTGTIKKDNFYAKVRNYDSARHAALDGDNIPEQVYENLVEAVNEKIHLLHRYTALRKKVLELEELHMYDMYTPLVQNVEMKIPYEKAQEYVVDALQPLGEDYVNTIKEGYQSRWIDVEENKGKRSGAYSSGAYGTNPYVLLNWQDNVNDLFTLAHELGHSLHSYYTRKSQPFRYGNYSIFVAEVASTCNEALLNEYMLNHLEDEKEKLFLLNHFLEGFRGTVFRQTMFAEFEHDIHKRMQEGEALTAEKLTEIYYALNKKYFGDEVISDEEIGLEWSRIPHFYYNYYVFQYATGYSAATALANQILTDEDGSAVERYLNFLKAGSSDFPIEVLKKAGVDMTSKQPILEALDVFEEKLNEMEEMLLK
ncbi:oligoendopeptidase F [Virgibacillus phasianinus]|uniref:Oligopeptidase F n=1 Tax=Virgibacillus phasianinus TaxID=2017483 RepID=A0A220TYK8_9BACI|nr:oligoendopeptidase F [Virgibacillus phasianinus]ASK60796.1 oligoendopeptidase F [Virgibacillus phasianinus]